MKLLGDTQTFIGVILTLNVLCIFLDENNNFIMRLLSGQTKRLIALLAEFEQRISDCVRQFKESETYIRVANLASNTAPVSKGIKEKAQMLNYATTVNVFGYQTDISESYSPLDSVKRYIEQVLAPVYCLCYGIIIFLLDEIGRFLPADSDLFIFAISISLILSAIYWASIWATFMIHSASPHDRKEKRQFWIWMDEKIGILVGALLKLILCGIVYYAALRLLPWSSFNPFGKVLMSIMSFSLPIFIIGIIRTHCSNVKGFYSYAHCLGHLGAILIYALIIAAIYQWVKPMVYEDLGFLIDRKILAFLIALFLLFNGILFPFLFPMWRCLIIYRDKRNSIRADERRITDYINRFSSDYQELIIKIGEDVANGKLSAGKHKKKPHKRR